MSEETIGEKFRPLMDNAIKPNADEIAKIIAVGDIALVAYQPSDGWADALRIPRGTYAAIAKLTSALRKRLVKNADSVTARWLEGHRLGRVFVVWGSGSALLNFRDGAWSVEPGSTNGELN